MAAERRLLPWTQSPLMPLSGASPGTRYNFKDQMKQHWRRVRAQGKPETIGKLLEQPKFIGVLEAHPQAAAPSEQPTQPPEPENAVNPNSVQQAVAAWDRRAERREATSRTDGETASAAATDLPAPSGSPKPISIATPPSAAKSPTARARTSSATTSRVAGSPPPSRLRSNRGAAGPQRVLPTSPLSPSGEGRARTEEVDEQTAPDEPNFEDKDVEKTEVQQLEKDKEVEERKPEAPVCGRSGCRKKANGGVP